MVEIIPYQESWPSEFQAIAASLRQALGELALRIDHIGSTSVPGLSAKDVIDIQVTVAALDDRVRSAMAPLATLGGRHGAIIARPMWLDQKPNGISCCSCHRRINAARIPTCACRGVLINATALLFRDYLREHPRPPRLTLNSSAAWRNIWRIRKRIRK